MDADSSYGGSDTAQDSHSGVHDHHQIHDGEVSTAVHQVASDPSDQNHYYHKNEITLPVNYEEVDYQADRSRKEPHYLSTANLNINDDPHTNLEDMSNFKSTNFLNQDSPKNRKRAGIENPAFQEDDPRSNGSVKSTFDSTKPYNGELNSVPAAGGRDPAAEAVNLELINLKPTPGKDVAGPYDNGPYDNGVNGIPVKKDQDLDAGSNAYDEYFVPVNEHRKYMSKTRRGRGSVTFAEGAASGSVEMDPDDDGVVEYPRWMTNSRGEKLYVTMDKRNKKGRNKCLCWGLCLCIAAAIVILGILGAVGVIGNQGPMAKEVSARKFDGSEPEVKGGSLFGASDIGNTQPPPEQVSLTPGPPLSTVPSMLPSTETSMIEVPRALESQLIIENMNFTPQLFDQNSTQYQALAKSLEDEIKNMLFSKNVLNYGPANIEVKVMDFTPGSVVVKYRIGWVFKEGIHNAKDPITKESLVSKIVSSLERNNDLIGNHQIKDDSISAQKILDLCQIQNNDCEHICMFDYKHLNFICTCPKGKKLADDKKKCIDIEFNSSNHNHFEDDYSEPKPAKSESTGEPEPSSEPEPSPEPEPNVEPKPSSSSKPLMEPVAPPETTLNYEKELSETEAVITTEPPTVYKPKPSSNSKPFMEPMEPPQTTLNYEKELSESEAVITTEPHTDYKPSSSSKPLLEPEAPLQTTLNYEKELSEIETVITTEPPTDYKRKLSSSSKSLMEPVEPPETTVNYEKELSEIEAVITTEPPTDYKPKPSSNSKPLMEPVEPPETTLNYEKELSEIETVITTEPPTDYKPKSSSSSKPLMEPVAPPETTLNYEKELSETEAAVTTPSTEISLKDSIANLQPTVGTESQTEYDKELNLTTVEISESPHEIGSTSEEIKPDMSTETVEHITSHENKQTHSDYSSYHHINEVSAEQISTTTPLLQYTSQKPSELNYGIPVIVTQETPQATTTIENETETSKTLDTLDVDPLIKKTTVKPDQSEGRNFIHGASLEQISSEEPQITTEPLSETSKNEYSKVKEVTIQPTTTASSDISLETIVPHQQNSVNEVDIISSAKPSVVNTTNHSSISENDILPSAVTIASVAATETTIYVQETATIKTEPEISTKKQLLSEKTIQEMNLINIVTPEAEVITSTIDITSPTPLEDTTNKLENNDSVPITTIREQLVTEHFIPVIINGSQNNIETGDYKNYKRNFTNTSDLTTSQPEYRTVPVIINNEQLTVDEEEPKIIELTTKSEIKQNDNITDMLLNQTHPEVQTERIFQEDLSPFLPNIENDTLVNTLHSDEHFIDHPFLLSEDEVHEVKNETEKPPSLENDQLNHTNPSDPTPIQDAGLAVVPLGNKENEILTHNEVNVTANVTESELNSISNQTDQLNNTEKVETTTIISMGEGHTMEINNGTIVIEKSSESENETRQSEKVLVITTVLPTNKSEEVTLPPDIINNVHSNSYFENTSNSKENILLQIQQVNDSSVKNTTEQPNHVSNFKDFGSSTEDLLALETTTQKKTDTLTTVKNTATNNYNDAPTIHGDIFDTATETFRVKMEDSMTIGSPINASSTIENNVANFTSEQNITTSGTSKDNTVSSSNVDITTVLPLNKYEVRETITDITTTEKLFLSVKEKEDSPEKKYSESVEEEGNLSVIPLEKSDDINNLEGDSNDISDEETKSVIDKYQTEKKLEKKENIHNDKYEKLDKKDLFIKNPELIEKTIDSISTTTEETVTAVQSDIQQIRNFNNGLKPVTENFDLPSFPRCASGQFQCINGTSVKDGSYCIPGNDRCDSVPDCSDGSDELNCTEDGCPNNFKCASGQCLKRHLVCDGIVNCNDSTDEINCDKWECNADEFSCGTGKRCIPLLWKCDGKFQCPDNTDEHNCQSTQCSGDSFHCIQQNTCIPLSWRCDGTSDCTFGDDEKLCECNNETFKCQSGGGCISKSQRCDGITQCADRSDEWNCLQMKDKNILQIESETNTSYPVCGDSVYWNITYANLACESMGFPGASSFEFVPVANESKTNIFYVLKEKALYGMPFLAQLEQTENGSCGKWISLTCQEYTCDANSIIDIQQARSAGGERAAPTQWPSLVLLRDTRRNTQCSATLVAPAWVAASYACVTNGGNHPMAEPKDWELYAGSTNFFGSGDNSSTQLRKVAEIVPYPQAKFYNFEYTNDVALVKLSQPLTLNRNVSVLCLPNTDFQPRQLCVIVGWGINKPGDPNQEQYLNYLPLPIMELEKCNSSKHYNGLLSKDKICAGYTGSEKSPCYNDEGAPLMCFEEKSQIWELRGLLSHHENCGKSGHPAIFTSLSAQLRNWITNTIGAASLSSRGT